MNHSRKPVSKAGMDFGDAVPFSLEVEEKVIGSMLFDFGNIYPLMIDRGIDDSFFYLSSHQLLYQIMFDIYDNGQMPDTVTVMSRLAQKQKADVVGGQNGLIALVEKGSSGHLCTADGSKTYVESWLHELIALYQRRMCLRHLDEYKRTLTDPGADVEEATDNLQEQLYEVAQRGISKREQVWTMPRLAAQFIKELESGQTDYIQTGIQELDELTGGIAPGYYLFGGMTGMGKTHWLVNIIYMVATQGYPVLMFSCEMSAECLMERFVSRHTGIPSDRINQRRLSANEWQSVRQAQVYMSKLPISIYDVGNPKLGEMRQQIRTFERRFGQVPAFIGIDYFQKLSWYSGSRVDDLSRISRDLFQVMREYKTRILCLAQVKHEVGQRNNKRPTQNDIRLCGDATQDADGVFMIHREDYYDAFCDNKGETEINLCKSRRGRGGTIKFLHELSTSQYLSINLPGGGSADDF
jgi:replicative DNA helicase